MFTALIGSLFNGLIIKFIAHFAGVHRSGYLHCYMLSLVGFAALWGIRSTGYFEHVLLLALQFLIHFLGALVILDTKAKTAALIACACLLTITIQIRTQPITPAPAVQAV